MIGIDVIDNLPYDDEKMIKAEEILLSDSSIILKIRALHYLRMIKTKESAEIICKVFSQNSLLLKHEAMYALGQMRISETKDFIIKCLNDKNQDSIIRQDAARALANFGDRRLIPFLGENLHEKDEVSGPCLLAIKKLLFPDNEPSPFNSFDSVFSMSESQNKAEEYFFSKYSHEYECLMAMFTLRNENTPRAAKIISKGFKKKSFFIKKECAFALGQMKMKESVEPLKEVLSKEDELPIVRHEAAIALGCIGTEEAAEILKKYISHSCEFLRESCEVGLHMIDCKKNNLEFMKI
ncbi:Deoxyhypusine hydroxylase [Dictyocoela muelleri]|nr:Deoxyhypusine hydroxylase [Dictyocoela muelleri]